ncbi:ankyrin repeat-containing protein [Elysia marginata]|uniref:Ankyrin repeat-containing protein n=1 Tax=Elysia marginata TaxID=1093978 RepID=A0AAV4H337_9GAST|nr:ankyrin repeat-containing protein [Elysia marginata]
MKDLVSAAGSRESLDFDFESDLPTMSSSGGPVPVANVGIGLNGKLLRAVIQNKYGSVRYCLKCGADPNATTPDKRSALHLAVINRQMNIIRLLLDAGAYHSPLDKSKSSPLHFACSPPQRRFIQTLLNGGADPNAGSQVRSHCCYSQSHPILTCFQVTGLPLIRGSTKDPFYIRFCEIVCGLPKDLDHGSQSKSSSSPN